MLYTRSNQKKKKIVPGQLDYEVWKQPTTRLWKKQKKILPGLHVIICIRSAQINISHNNSQRQQQK